MKKNFPVLIRLIDSSSFNEKLLNEMFQLSNSLIPEEYEHWKKHADRLF